MEEALNSLTDSITPDFNLEQQICGLMANLNLSESGSPVFDTAEEKLRRSAFSLLEKDIRNLMLDLKLSNSDSESENK